MEKKRNGTVELLRFIFCMVILTFHISLDTYGGDWRPLSWGGIMRYGALGVEFFFITSGYLMAKSVMRMETKPENIASETWGFIRRKLAPILPYHICFNLAAYLVSIVRGQFYIAESVNKLSCFLFLPTLGFNNKEWMLGAEWYIGYMLFVMLIIYPFIRYFKITFITYFAPISSLVLYGVLYSRYGTVMGSERMIEAFAGILLGIAVYGICGGISDFTERCSRKGIRLAIRMYPLITLTAMLIYMNSDISTEVQSVVVVFFALGLAVTFAEQGIISHTGILNNGFVYWLGKISLPIYMIQNITRTAVMTVMQNKPAGVMYLSESVLTIVCGIMAFYFFEFVKAKRNEKQLAVPSLHN